MKNASKNTVFRSLLISYTFVLLLSLLAGSFFFVYTMHSLNNHLSDISMLTVSQLQKITDSEIEELNKTCDSVLMQSPIQSLKYQTSYPFSTKKIDQLKQLQNYISNQVASNPLISEIYIHFLNSDTVLSAGDIYHGDEFSSKVQSSLLTDYPTYLSLIDFDGFRQNKSIERDGEQSVFIMQKNAVTSKGRPADIVITMILDMTEFRRILDQLSNAEDFHVSIVDADEHVFVGNEIIYEPDLNYDAPDENLHNGLLSKLWHDIPITTRINSDVTSWTYYFTLPIHIYTNIAKKDIFVMILFSICSFVCGILLCYYLSKRQYAPLKQLVNKILQHTQNPAPDSAQNEYNLIEQSLLSFLQEKQLSEEELKNYHSMLIEKITRNLLLGNTSYDFRHKKSKELDLLNLQYDNYIVLLFNCNYNSTKFIENSCSPSGIMLSVIRQMLPSLLDDNCIYHTIILNNDVVCLLNLPDSAINQENFYQTLGENFSYLQQYVFQKLNLYLYAAVSNLHFSLDSVSSAYQEVLDIREYIQVTGTEQPVLFYSAVNIDDTGNDIIPDFMEQQRMLINLFRSRDFEKSRTIFEGIMKNFTESQSSLREIKMKMSSLINTLVTALEEVKDSFHHSFYEDVNPTYLLYHSQSIKDLQNNMNYIRLEQKKRRTYSIC